MVKPSQILLDGVESQLLLTRAINNWSVIFPREWKLLPGRAILQGHPLRMTLGSPFQSPVPELSGPVFSFWATLLPQADSQTLQAPSLLSLLRVLGVALCSSHLLSLLGWRNVREKGLGLHPCAPYQGRGCLFLEMAL